MIPHEPKYELQTLQEPVALTKTLMKLKRIWVSLIYPWKSQLVTQLAREVSYHVCILCFHMGLIRWTFLHLRVHIPDFLLHKLICGHQSVSACSVV